MFKSRVTHKCKVDYVIAGVAICDKCGRSVNGEKVEVVL